MALHGIVNTGNFAHTVVQGRSKQHSSQVQISKMADREQATRKHPCPGCGGSGQTSYFGGESRFMLTWEDCPDCCGTGVVLDETGSSDPKETEQP